MVVYACFVLNLQKEGISVFAVLPEKYVSFLAHPSAINLCSHYLSLLDGCHGHTITLKNLMTADLHASEGGDS